MTDPSHRRRRVVVVADHLLVADVVVLALTAHGFDATSVDLSEAGPLEEVLPRIADDPPDVLLLDLDLASHPAESLFVAPLVRTGVEVVLMAETRGDAVRAVEAGARYIPKTSPLAELVGTLSRLTAAGPLRPTPA